MIKEIVSLWNTNFDKGITIFQIFLIVGMIAGAILQNNTLVLFSMTACLFSYFEPTENRFSFNLNKSNKKGGKDGIKN